MSEVADKIRYEHEIYARQYKVYVYLANCDRCSLAPLARKNLVQPHIRSDTFANSKYVATISNTERKMDWS